MSSRAEKTALFEAIALMGKAFASATRLELLDLLAQAPRTVDDLARVSGQSTANVSQHLQALYTAGLVTREREGTRVRYALAGDDALRVRPRDSRRRADLGVEEHLDLPAPRPHQLALQPRRQVHDQSRAPAEQGVVRFRHRRRAAGELEPPG